MPPAAAMGVVSALTFALSLRPNDFLPVSAELVQMLKDAVSITEDPASSLGKDTSLLSTTSFGAATAQSVAGGSKIQALVQSSVKANNTVLLQTQLRKHCIEFLLLAND